MPSTVRGNHPLCLLLLESSWLWRLPTVSSYLCDKSFFPFLSPATFYLSCCPVMSLAVTVLFVCVCMARAVYIGTNEQQYPSSWWELRDVVSVQPCAKMEGGCSTEERGLRGKEMQRLAEGGREEELCFRWEVWGRWQPCLFFLSAWETSFHIGDIQGMNDQNRKSFKVYF